MIILLFDLSKESINLLFFSHISVFFLTETYPIISFVHTSDQLCAKF
jgi:hypothetical protein